VQLRHFADLAQSSDLCVIFSGAALSASNTAGGAGDDGDYEDVKQSSTAPPALSGMQALLAQQAGQWYCESCLLGNSQSVDRCASCCTPRPGSAAAASAGDHSKTAGPSFAGLMMNTGGASSEVPTQWTCPGEDCGHKTYSADVRVCPECEEPAPFATNRAAP